MNKFCNENKYNDVVSNNIMSEIIYKIYFAIQTNNLRNIYKSA